MRSRADYLEAQYKLLRAAGHDACARKLLRDAGDDLCDACEAECECCGEQICWTSGRDESISGAVLCLDCTLECQNCPYVLRPRPTTRRLEQFFCISVWPCLSGERQLLPLCKHCSGIDPAVMANLESESQERAA